MLRVWSQSMVCTFLVIQPLAAQATRVVFEGEPLKKVETSFDESRTTHIAGEDAFGAQVRIVERGGRYYWQTRGMKELLRRESGAYVTYQAIDGSGYIRVGATTLLDLRDRLPEEQRQREIGYVEHLLVQFASVTYFGNRIPPGK